MSLNSPQKEQRECFSFILTLFILLSFSSTICGQDIDRSPLKLKVGSFNVGHFNQGQLGGFQKDNKWAKAELNNWRYWIGQQNFDIFSLNEWNLYFDKDSSYHAEKELLAPFYSNVYFGDQNTWIYNGIATNYTLSNIRQINLAGDYYAIIGDLEVKNKTIQIISVHVPWQKEWHDASLDSLINVLKGFEYFICMGDTNSSDESQGKFSEAGFNRANGGYLGWFPTTAGRISSTGYRGTKDNNIDNIITSSNIKIMKVSAPKTGLNDLDHLPIIAHLIVTQ